MTYEVTIPTRGWVQEVIPGSRGPLHANLDSPRAVAEVEIAPRNGQRRWLAVSLVEVRGAVEIEDESVYALDPEGGGKIELGCVGAANIRLVR